MAVFAPQIHPEVMFWPQIQPAIKCRLPIAVAQGLMWLGASRSGCAACMSGRRSRMASAVGVGSFSGDHPAGLAASMDLKWPVWHLPI